jgi:hypothetical protein
LVGNEATLRLSCWSGYSEWGSRKVTACACFLCCIEINLQPINENGYPRSYVPWPIATCGVKLDEVAQRMVCLKTEMNTVKCTCHRWRCWLRTAMMFGHTKRFWMDGTRLTWWHQKAHFDLKTPLKLNLQEIRSCNWSGKSSALPTPTISRVDKWREGLW